MRPSAIVLPLVVVLAALPGVVNAQTDAAKSRVLVLTDIGNEVDDQESLVRFLLYSNEYDVEGIVATTSTWLRDKVHPELIDERVRAYGQVLPNLRVHAAGFPRAEALQSKIRAGRAEYGTAGVGQGKDTDASRLITQAVDSADPRPLWIAIWGGSVDLAQSLWSVEHTRRPAEVARFVSRLRVYSISDQDDAGPWARAEFPKLWWVTSIHAFNDYALATWTGISVPYAGADGEVVSHRWLDEHIRKGPLGALYPQWLYAMEGDTPSFLNLIANGLSVPEHPDWGGWGGRYGRLSENLGLWASAADTVKGMDGSMVTSAPATVWRWRSAFQNDFAARINWSIAPRYQDANHNPILLVNGEGGLNPIAITACVGRPVALSAAGSHDPDRDSIRYRWWVYTDAGRTLPIGGSQVTLSDENGPQTSVLVAPPTAPGLHLPPPDVRIFHVILEGTDSGSPPLTSYRRIVLTVPSPATALARERGCDAG
jgi:hypothetical protein